MIVKLKTTKRIQVSENTRLHIHKISYEVKEITTSTTTKNEITNKKNHCNATLF